MVLRDYVAIVDQTVGLQAWPSRQLKTVVGPQLTAVIVSTTEQQVK